MCKYSSTLKTGAVESQYASDKSRPSLIDPADPSLGISNAEVQVVNGEITCKFSRLARSPNETFSDKYFDISQSDMFHILAAKG